MSVNLRKISLVVLCLLLLQGLAWTGTALAQEEPPERPPLPSTEGGSGGDGGDGGDDDDGGVAPGLPGAAVSGFVYDYSTVVHPGGVKVVLDGGGWQLETLTDSRGYYRFDGLGSGSAVLNLRLPPGAHPVVFDWPLWLGPGADLQVNLGYYWGDGDLLPVIVSGSLQGDTLLAEVTNRMDHALTGGELKVILPASLRGGPAFKASQGSMSSYDAHELQLALGQLAAGQTVTVEIPVKAGGAPAPAAAEAQLIFTFDQQQTPFMAAVTAQAGPAQANTLAQAATATPPARTRTNPPASAATAAPSTPAAPAPPTPAAGRPASPLPETGASGPGTPAPLALAVLLAVLLAVTGLRSINGRN